MIRSTPITKISILMGLLSVSIRTYYMLLEMMKSINCLIQPEN